MTKTKAPWRLLVVGTALAIVLSACASDAAESETDGMREMEGMEHGEHAHEEEAAPAAVEGAPEVEVTARSFAFEPSELTVTAGEPVNVALTSTDLLHDFVVEGEDFHLAADRDETVTGALTIDEPGTYTVYCSVAGHREAGMEATLTVEEA
jgi:plastocyanin